MTILNLDGEMWPERTFKNHVTFWKMEVKFCVLGRPGLQWFYFDRGRGGIQETIYFFYILLSQWRLAKRTKWKKLLFLMRKKNTLTFNKTSKCSNWKWLSEVENTFSQSIMLIQWPVSCVGGKVGGEDIFYIIIERKICIKNPQTKTLRSICGIWTTSITTEDFCKWLKYKQTSDLKAGCLLYSNKMDWFQ